MIKVNISLSRDSGATWSSIAESVDVGDGSKTWTVTGPETSNAKIRVSSLTDSTVYGASASDFSIVLPLPRTITVISPNGWETWSVGSNPTISWTASSSVTGNVNVSLSRDGGASWTVIVPSVAASTGMVDTWEVVGPETANARVKVASLADPAVYGTSFSDFTITASPPPAVDEAKMIMSTADRRSHGLYYWPDGTMGVLKEGSSYVFWGANSIKLAKTVGNLDDPVAVSTRTGIPISHPKTDMQYAAGGPVYRDAATGTLIMVYHGERWPGGDPQKFYSVLGLAKSADGGDSWNDLGLIVTPQLPFEKAGKYTVEVTAGSFVIVGDYFYIYFRDYREDGSINELAVARARVADVVAAAIDGVVVPWTKYFNERWEEPGLGGFSSFLETGNPLVRWLDVSYNEFSGRYIMVVAGMPGPGQVSLYLISSPDGLAWSPRTLVQGQTGENMYPTLVGTSDGQRTTGATFYIFYTYSAAGEWWRWNDAVLMRLTLSYSPE